MGKVRPLGRFWARSNRYFLKNQDTFYDKNQKKLIHKTKSSNQPEKADVEVNFYV